MPKVPPSSIDVDYIRTRSWNVTTTYNASSIITYNLSLGAAGSDLPLVFEGHPSFHALPTFGTLPVITAMGAVTRSMPELLPNFQPHNHVHGEHYLELKRPFPVPGPGEEILLETEARVLDVVARRSGVTVCVGITSSVEGSGEAVCYNEWTSFIMKVPPGGAADRPTKFRGPTRVPANPERPPDCIVEQKTTPEQAALYRAASGDLNPLHIDPEVAKRGGFDGPILTGTCTLGMGVKHVLDEFAEGNVRRFGSAKVRLSKPVIPGEVVSTEMWKVEGGVAYRQCVGDEVVIKDGYVTLRAEETKL